MTRRDSRGFALIIVLWTLALIAFIVVLVTASGRTEVRIAGNLFANAQADAAADGAVYQAVFELSGPRDERRWNPDGRPRELTIGGSRVTVWAQDESARINPNLASPALMTGLLRATGSDPETARRLAAAIADWIGRPVVPRPQQAVLAAYRAAGRDYGPPDAMLESLDELGRVVGITPAVLDAIRPHLSLFSGAEPTIEHADPVVRAALAIAARDAPPPATPAAPPAAEGLTARIAALARGPGNARLSHTAIVRIDPRLPGGYAVLAWDAATR